MANGELKMKERELSKSIIQLLQYEENKGNLYFIRNNSYAGYLSHSRNAPGHYTRQGRAGCSDIIVFFKGGKTQFWELKAEKHVGHKILKGQQSKEQKEFEIKIGLLGYRYYLITELSQAENCIRNRGC